MKGIILLLLSALQALGSYGFTRKITIDHTKVLTGLTSFPMAFAGTYTFLKTAANGGQVQSASGYDIVFSTDAGNSSPIACEMEAWSATTGTSVFWVNIPTLSSTVDTVIYIHYGDSSITTQQCAGTTVWDSNYKAVYHFGAQSGFLNDSTANGNTLSNSGSVTTGTGILADGASFSGSNALWKAGVPTTAANTWTLEGWVAARPSGNSPTTAFNGVWNVSGWGIRTEQPGAVFQCVTGAIGGGDCSSATAGGYFLLAGVDTAGSSKVYIGNVGGGFAGGAGGGLTGSTPTTIFAIGAAGVTAAPTFQASTFLSTVADEVRVSDIARSANWLQTEFNSISSPSTFYAVGIIAGNRVFPILY